MSRLSTCSSFTVRPRRGWIARLIRLFFIAIVTVIAVFIIALIMVIAGTN